MQTSEAAIVQSLVVQALAAGYLLTVFDGEEFTVRKSDDQTTILAALYTTEADLLIAYRDGKRAGSVWLVWGNGQDVISDYSYNQETVSGCAWAALIDRCIPA